MCLRRKLAAAIFVATLLTSCFSPDKTFAADNSASVVNGNVRFQVLSPSLVRMEYSPKSNFVDEASVAVVGRSDFSGVAPKTSEKDGWLTLSTEKMAVSYKLGSGPFSKDNLRIAWSDKSGEHAWKPGDQDAKNLGGVPGTMDGRSMVAVTEPGPLSRNGYYWLDDSRTALFDKATDWVKPRPEKDSLDWYFFVYGNDFAGAVEGDGPAHRAGSHVAALRVRPVVRLAGELFGRAMADDRRSVSRRAASGRYDRVGFTLCVEGGLVGLRSRPRANARPEGIFGVDEAARHQGDDQRAL